MDVWTQSNMALDVLLCQVDYSFVEFVLELASQHLPVVEAFKRLTVLRM